MSKGKTGVLLVNLGTPDSPKVKDVKKYLREFLMDERVIDMPFLGRWLLVNGVIATFRSPKSAKEYEKLWDEEGSPLKFYGYNVRDLLQKSLGDLYTVVLGMRYQNPSLAHALHALQTQNVSKIVVIPLFPQYASATTGSVVQKVNEIIKNWQVIPSMVYVNQFMDHPQFIEAFATQGKKMMEKKNYDHVVFSYHGLPERQVKKASIRDQCQLGDCCDSFHEKNQYCYRAQCFLTSRLLAEKLELEPSGYTTTFQSRLGRDPWIQPYTDEILKTLPAQGKKNILAFSPAFVADCLETTIEVGEAFAEDFRKAGGEAWDLVPSLNDTEVWITCLKNLVESA